jgi:hypothetical protein
MQSETELNEIPERFHILFKSDWNTGNECKMNIYDRIHFNELFLEYNKWKIRESIIKISSTEESEIQIGFIKD